MDPRRMPILCPGNERSTSDNNHPFPGPRSAKRPGFLYHGGVGSPAGQFSTAEAPLFKVRFQGLLIETHDLGVHFSFSVS